VYTGQQCLTAMPINKAFKEAQEICLTLILLYGRFVLWRAVENIHHRLNKKMQQEYLIEYTTQVKDWISIFWDTTQYSPLKVNRCFGGTCRLHPQGRRINQTRNQRESRCQAELSCWFSFGLFLDLEDVGSMFLRNVTLLSTDYTVLYTRR
jgi:hypothetical protein